MRRGGEATPRADLVMLAAFQTLRRKNLATLYDFDTKDDRSPKGSVDCLIQGLVDCINQHPEYVTLSSCSGRIAVFDPGHSDNVGEGSEVMNDVLSGEEEPDIEQVHTSHNNGKGGAGTWLLVSHESVDSHQLLSVLPKASASSCLYVEPLVLHVAAASVTAGKALWQAAVRAGCRESGLGITDRRVTVAIRTQRGRLAVPIHPSASKEYWEHVVGQANLRLRQNGEQLDRLHHEVEVALFPEQRLAIQVRTGLPNLGLARAAVVSLDDSTIASFGGYGVGPTSGPQRRSSFVHLLHHNNPDWEVVEPSSSTTNEASVSNVTTPLGPLRVRPISWSKRVNATASVVSQSLVLLFGGHNGPAHPVQPSLILYDTSMHTAFEVIDIRGDCVPGPRWGHKCSTIVEGSSWLLVGGRNTTTVLKDSVHRLDLQKDEDTGEAFLLFRSLPPIPPVFDHAVVRLHTPPATYLVHGGLTSVARLSQRRKPAVLVMLDSPPEFVEIEIAHRFGHQMNLLSLPASATQWILITGGVAFPSSEPIISCLRIGPGRGRSLIDFSQVPLVCEGDLEKLGVLVHHSALQTSSGKGTITIVGGGVAGFAFGHAYASSAVVGLKLLWDAGSQENEGAILHFGCGEDRHTAQSSAVTSGSGKLKKGKAPVIYVAQKDTKRVKDALEEAKLLDKDRRITQIDIDGIADSFLPKGETDWTSFVAIPVMNAQWRPDPNWQDGAIIGHGHQECRWSSRCCAAGSSKK